MSGGFKYIESNRVSKAQKRRQAKAAKKADQSKRIEEGEKLDEHKDRRLEQESLDKILRSKGLKVHDIDADGDCLYRAVEHQLSLADDSDERLTCPEIRNRTCEYMLKNSDQFMPFLLNNQGDLMEEREFNSYCNRIATTKEWGGHLELTAIAQITRKPIHIYQADQTRPLIIEPQTKSNKKPMLLSFHKHLYHLGAYFVIGCVIELVNRGSRFTRQPGIHRQEHSNDLYETFNSWRKPWGPMSKAPPQPEWGVFNQVEDSDSSEGEAQVDQQT